MTVRELREKYLSFFESKGHRRFPSGSLIPYDVTGRLDESLLFNGAGMIQFKPYFRGVAQPAHPRLTTCQKCVRTGDIDEVGDDTHLTFFEMLGNFSFGDYFKEEAIRFSWEFLTSPEWLALDPARLSFTVFETDDVAESVWKSVGVRHVFRLGEESNYWPAGAFSKGPPGPCGPNSEMFYWTSKEETPPGEGYTREEWERDEAAGKWVEIWNDVFIQYEWQGEPNASGKGYVKTAMPELPFRSIDTGMGLERTVLVLNGNKSVYDTDAFTGILAKIKKVSVVGPSRSQVSGTVPVLAEAEVLNEKAERIVADHVRTATFCVADGVLPSNNGRGYVLRRLIRRAVLRGSRDLGAAEGFFATIAETVIEEYGGFYGNLIEQRSVIVETLRNEEALFRRTLDRGEQWFADTLDNLLPNALMSFTYAVRQDPTWDLPMSSDLRQFFDLEPSDGITMDDETHDLYTKKLGEVEKGNRRKNLFQEMARLSPTLPPHLVQSATPVFEGREAFSLYDTFGFPVEVTQELAAESGLSIDFEGYELALKEAQARSRGAQDMDTVYGGVSGDDEALPDAPSTTDFLGYDQLSSSARIVRKRKQGDKVSVALDQTPFYAESGGQVGDTGWLRSEGRLVKVTATKKANNVWWHDLEEDLPLGAEVVAQVAEDRRARIRRHHTATHLLHLALRETLGGHATQAGSYVGPDRLRFDFTHGKALTDDERTKIEARVNELALQNAPVVTHVDITPDEAKALGAMALFGEKYGDRVRMVEVGPSKELCGGVHVRTAAEIGTFRIVSEGSAQSGVRRIEAIAGEAAQEASDEDRRILRALADRLKTQPAALAAALEKTLDQLKEERKRREKAESSSAAPSEETTVQIGDVTFVTMDLGEIDPKTAAKRVDDATAGKPLAVVVSAVRSEGKVQFTAKAGAEAVAKGAHSGNLLREVARIAGGGGGGRPDFATAGGKDATKIPEALAAAEAVLRGQIGL